MPDRSTIYPLLPGPSSGTRASARRGSVERVDIIDGSFTAEENETGANSGAPNSGVGGSSTANGAAGVSAYSLLWQGDEAQSQGDGSWGVPLSTYFAQHVAQEVLPEGLYIDPHPAGIAAYRDVLTTVSMPTAVGFDFRA